MDPMGGGFSMAMSVLPEDIFPPLFCQMLHLATVDELRDMKKRSYFRGFFMEVMVFENLRFQAHDPNTRKLAKGFYVVVKMWQFFLWFTKNGHYIVRR